MNHKKENNLTCKLKRN